MEKQRKRLYFITDSTGLDEGEFLHRVEKGLQGGASLLQLREKEKTTREYLHLAEKVHDLTKRYHVPLIIDDRLDVAMAVDAEGVHLGQSDLPIFMARRLWGKEKIIGATAKTVEKAKEAYEGGADYVGVGAMYPTKTKVKTVLTPVDTLREIVKNIPIPVYAIGGLKADNLHILKGIPIAGICVVSAIMQAECPEKAARKIREAMNEI